MNTRTLSMHILRALADAQTEGRRESLDTLVDQVQVRRRDVRAAVTALHQQGLVDAVHMRLTLQGFAVGRSLLAQELPALRSTAERRVAAA
jgi:ABC-type ATPase with predicted acetyltransferase domain